MGRTDFTRPASGASWPMSSAPPGETGRALLRCARLWLLNAMLAMICLHSAHAASARTIVSLTFDDGLTQSAVGAILRNHGLKATFYVNANLVGSGGGYLTKAELDALFTDGHEIGGHTTNHVDLATLSDAAQRTAICSDMQTLNTWYPNQIHSFAYPYASTGPTTQSIVASGCTGVGTYSSARTVGGLVSGNQCTGCPSAETIPPGNAYYINTPESILSTTTLDQIKTLVTQAENGGGGWVPLVFHSVCSGCSSYAVTAATLDAFLTWLKARETTNFTYVRTVNQVMTGDLPAPPPPPPMGPNQVINPSLELDQDVNGLADCWSRDGYGTNTATWARTSDAHSGSFAERLQISAYSSGDRKLLPTLDAGQALGGCAPTVQAGAQYELGAWYKSTTQVVPVLFYRDSGGTWRYWRDGPALPASASWAQWTYYPGAMPAGAQALSFGIALDSVGTVTTDDYSLRRILDAAADTTPPTVAITAPSGGTTVSGSSVSVTAGASDNVGVVGVQFRLDGSTNLGAEDTTAPYLATWNTIGLANGSHTLTAVARDAAGNRTTSAAVTVTVNNAVADTTPPTVSISAPAAGTVSGIVTVAATATDNVGVVGVQFRLDGVALGAEDTTSPYSIAWNTATASNGTHTLTSVARDAAGNTTISSAVSVTVNNGTVNTAPVANADLFLYRANVARNVSAPGLLRNDTDAQNNPLVAQFVAGSLVNGGTLSCAGSASPSICTDGSFSYLRATGDNSISFAYRASDGSLASTNASVALRVDTAPTTVGDNCSYSRAAGTVTQPARCTVVGIRTVRMNVVANDYDRNHPNSPDTLNNPSDGIGQTVVAASMRVTAVGSGVDVLANPACGQAALGQAPGTAATILNNCDGTLTVMMSANNTQNVIYNYRVRDDLGAQSSARQVTLSSVP